MARKSRKRKRHGPRGRSKRLGGRILLIAGLVLALLYFAFTKVLFDPFEDDQPPYHLLVPRDVDFFVRREALTSDVLDSGGFPVPRIFDRLRRTSEWREIEESAWWQGLTWPGELEALVDETEPQLRELPLDPVADVLGREVVLVGRDFKDGAHWALMGRLTNKAKLAVEIFGFDSTMESALPGATRELLRDEEYPEASYYRITLPGTGDAALPGTSRGVSNGDGADAAGDTYYYARETDLLVVSDDESLIKDVLHFVHGAHPERSVGLSRNYDQHMPRGPSNPTDRFSAGFAMTAGTLLEVWGLNPDTSAPREDALANIMLGLIDTGLLGDVVGRLELAPGEASLRMHGEVDFGRASNDQGGLLGQKEFDVDAQLREMLGLMPKDVSALVTMNVALGRFLTTASKGFSPDVLQLVNGTLRDVASLTAGWQVDTLPELIAELSRALGNQITMVVRPLDHQIPVGSQPLPAMAFLLPIDDLDAWLAIEDTFLRAHDLFGVSSDRMKQLEEGVGDRKWLGFVNQSIEEIAYIVLDRETLAISTDNDLLREIVQVYTGTRTSLAADPEVARMIDAFDRGGVDVATANAAAWVSVKGLQAVLEPYAEYSADLDTIIDFGVERVRQRKQLMKRDYRNFGETDTLPEDVEAELNKKLDEILDALEVERRSTTIPALAQQWRESWAWLPLLEQAAVGLRLGDRSMDLEVRLETLGGR